MYAVCLGIVLVASSLLGIFPVEAGILYGRLSAYDPDYFWISNVNKGNYVEIIIQADTWPYDWESKMCYSNLTLVKRISGEDTHIYEFIANETDDYLLRLFADFSLNCTIECNHLVTLAGDIDCDGDVDYRDLFILARAYGCREGEPCYNRNVDIICNGVIDYKDLFHLARNYGKNAYKD